MPEVPPGAEVDQEALIRAATIERLRKTSANTYGPGISTTIRATELKALLDEIDARVPVIDVVVPSEATSVVLVSPDGSRRPVWESDPEPVAAESGELVAALKDILEVHTELWGQPVAEALTAWCGQQGATMPDGWLEQLAAPQPVDASA